MTATAQRTVLPIAARLASLVAVFGAVALSLFGPAPSASAAVHGYSDDTEVRRIADKLQCPVCHGQSVAESNSQVAEGMKQTIGDLLEQGRSEGEIMEFFEARYGPGVLRNPPRTGIYSLVWWMPGVGILVGGGIIYSVLRRRRAADGGDLHDEAHVDPEFELYRERLRRDLELGG